MKQNNCDRGAESAVSNRDQGYNVAQRAVYFKCELNQAVVKSTPMNAIL